jgi:hypothetical protein
VAIDLRLLANCEPPADSVIHSVLAELFVSSQGAPRDLQQHCKVLDLLAAVPVNDEPPGSEPPLLRACLPVYGACGCGCGCGRG